MENSRREFIKNSALGIGGLALGFSAQSYGNIMGANDRLNIAFVGLGNRVNGYYDSLASENNVHLEYICDVKKSARQTVLKELENKISYTPKETEDIKEVLDDKNVDAIFNATPDHWHTPGAIMALKAGKHVYVEKPCSHNMAENKLIVEAQRKYDDLIVQMGNQQRSSPLSMEIIDKIHEGIIGRPYKAVTFYSNGRDRVPKPKPQAPPHDLNWNLFQGPAPREPYKHKIWKYDWHWYGWKYGTAETGNNATHELDVARWALQVDYPQSAYVNANKQHYIDDGWSMYDTMYASFKFEDNKSIVWDGKSRNKYQTYGYGRGTIVYGTEGSVFVNRSLYKLFDRNGEKIEGKSSSDNEQGITIGGGGGMTNRHVVNFYEAIRNNEEQNSPIDEGAKSVYMCHLANIASRVDKPLDIDSSDGRINDNEAMNLWGRDYEPGWEPKV
jgi:predicted dehydrogenase